MIILIRGIAVCAFALLAQLPISAGAQSARSAASWEQSCLGNEIGKDRETYCAAYGTFMTSMTPLQKRDYDQAFAACSDGARVGARKWTCEKAAYEAARLTPGSGTGIDLPRTQVPLALPKDFGSAPVPKVKIDETFKSEAAADDAAFLTIRVPIEYSGLPSLSVLRKHFAKDPLSDGGEPYLVVHCRISKSSVQGSVEAAAGIPWVENGAERTQTLSVRFFDRFGDGSLPTTGEEFFCAPWFGVFDPANAEISVFNGGTSNGENSGNLCANTPGYEVGQDDNCAAIAGVLDRGKLVKLTRFWSHPLPDGRDSEPLIPAE